MVARRFIINLSLGGTYMKQRNQKGQQYKMRFLDDEDHEKLKQKSLTDERSLNWLINQAIKEFLKKEVQLCNQ